MTEIREGMQVIGSDGGMVGRISGLHGDHLHVEPDAPSPHAGAHIVPRKWVARVDDHVHLNRPAPLVRDTWTSHGPGEVEAPADAHHGIGKSWIVWLIGAILLLMIIVLGIRGLGYAADEPDYRDDAKGELSEADREASGAAAERSGNSN